MLESRPWIGSQTILRSRTRLARPGKPREAVLAVHPVACAVVAITTTTSA